MSEKLIIDATGGMLGRVASFAAKNALLGKEIAIINCNDIMISGNREMILAKYQKLRSMGGSAQKGPNFPRMPEKIVKRTVRGMLPYRQERGAKALKNVMCYNEIPVEFEKGDKLLMKKDVKVKAFRLGRISKEI